MAEPVDHRHRRRPLGRDDGDDRTLTQMRALAHTLVDELCDELEWKRDLAYGPVAGETAGPVTGGRSDPTQGEATTRHGLRRQVATGRRDLRWLVDRKLPEMLDRLDTPDDEPRLSDQERGAEVSGGYSAYRGDRRAPAGRPSLQSALDAQWRRIQRGEAYGHG